MAFQIPENAKISVTSSFPIKQLILKDFNRVKRVSFTPVTQVANAKKKKKKKKKIHVSTEWSNNAYRKVCSIKIPVF